MLQADLFLTFLIAKEKTAHVYTFWRLQEKDAGRSKEAETRFSIFLKLNKVIELYHLERNNGNSINLF